MAMAAEYGRAYVAIREAAEKERTNRLRQSIRTLVDHYVDSNPQPLGGMRTSDKRFSFEHYGTKISGFRTDLASKAYVLRAISPDATEIALDLRDYQSGVNALTFRVSSTRRTTDWQSTPPIGVYFSERVNALWPQLDFIPKQYPDIRILRRKEKRVIDKVAKHITDLRDQGFVGVNGHITHITDDGGFEVHDNQDRVVASRVVTVNAKGNKHNDDMLTNYTNDGLIRRKALITNADEPSRRLAVAFTEQPVPSVELVSWKSRRRRQRNWVVNNYR